MQTAARALPEYEIFALRYATVSRQRHENFIASDPHDGPMPMDYFVWIVRNQERIILVDTGFNEHAAMLRKRDFLRCPIKALSVLGITSADITDVILTHLHYDHAGNIDLLPSAKLHLQEEELQYAVSRYMNYRTLRHAYAAKDVIDIVKGLYDERVTFYQGDAHFAPGIELIHVGGHTKGLQAVRVHTARGWVVLASDASHYYDNICNESPFPIVYNVGDMLEGYRKLNRLVETPDHLIPGHDPLVMHFYPNYGDQRDEIVALHLPKESG